MELRAKPSTGSDLCSDSQTSAPKSLSLVLSATESRRTPLEEAPQTAAFATHRLHLSWHYMGLCWTAKPLRAQWLKESTPMESKTNRKVLRQHQMAKGFTGRTIAWQARATQANVLLKPF